MDQELDTQSRAVYDRLCGAAITAEALNAASMSRLLQESSETIRTLRMTLLETEKHIAHSWECADSSIGHCVYSRKNDSAHDSCVICGLPEERK